MRQHDCVMDSALLSSPHLADLADLGRRLYGQSLVHRDHEYITDPDGEPVRWLLDTRIPMLTGTIAQEVGHVLAERLRIRRITQVAGYGFGAYPLVCATLGAPGQPALRGGFIRDGRKGHGRRRIVEGPLTKTRPLVLLDDILNSGTSATRALQLLRGEGYSVVGLTTLFEFTWSRGRSLLEAQGMWVDSLLSLNLRERDKGISHLG